MKFSALFEETLALWPQTVPIADAKLIDEKRVTFPSLNRAWEQAEEAAEQLSEWQELMVWAVFSGLNRQARSAFQSGATTIQVEHVDRVLVERQFSESLYSDSEPRYPAEMRSAYQNDLQP
jgi:hypothetical protein